MAFTTLELIVFAFCLILLLKLVILLINRKTWYDSVVEPTYQHASLASFIFGIIALYILFLLLKELTLVQIFGAVIFSSLLLGLSFLQFPQETLSFSKKFLNKKIENGTYILFIFWAIFAILTLFSLFE